MIQRLPVWVWGGGFVLAGIAGIVNSVGLLGTQHHAVTHVSGTVSEVAIHVTDGAASRAVHLSLLVIGFLLGAVLSGAIIRDSTLKLGRRYSAALVIESILLAAAIPLLDANHIMGEFVIAAACGLQNAMATTYSSAIVRTTHMTGVVTDIGILLGHRIRGERLDGRRLSLLLALLSGFISGGVSGALMVPTYGNHALWLPVALTSSIGVGYFIYKHRMRRREAEINRSRDI